MAEAGYPRDLHGHGRNPPDPRWPGDARIAVLFVVNFEEGGCRVGGRPGRAASLMRLLDYIRKQERVWAPTRLRIARHGHANLAHLAANARSIG